MMSLRRASFAGGCFWGVEARFREIPGVLDVSVGYMGGSMPEPRYEQVCSGTTGHAEAVQLEFDDTQVSFSELLDQFFALHDPTTLDRQGPDRGTQYRSAIFWHDHDQERAARGKIRALDAAGRWPNPIVTELSPATAFWRAEEYHQRYLEKNGGGFCHVQ
jgi:peptide-methionine (S)-S-oxide reductase